MPDGRFARALIVIIGSYELPSGPANWHPFRGTIAQRSRGLPAVSTDGSAGHRRQNQNRWHQDSRYPDDATDGGAASRRNATQRLAVPRNPSSAPHHFRPVGERLHPHPTPLRPSQDESPRPARTHRTSLQLSPLRQGGQSRAHVHPVPQARLRTAGKLTVPSPARRNPQASQQGRNGLS